MRTFIAIIWLLSFEITFAQTFENQYDYVGEKGSKLIVVSKNDKFGFVNHKGKLVIPLIYDSAWDFTFGLAAVQKGEKWGYINERGKVVIPFQFDYAEFFGEEYAPIKHKGEWYHINRKGKIIRKIFPEEVIIPEDNK